MTDPSMTNKELLEEISALKKKNKELEQSESELKKAEEALKESEEHYRGIVENIMDIYYRSNRKGMLIMVSPSGLGLLGYDSEDDFIGKSISDTFYFDPDERDRMLSILREKGSVRDFEVILKHKDGTPIPVSNSSRYYYDERGEILGIEGLFRDITDRKRVEEALQKSEEKFNRAFHSSPILTAISTVEDGRFLDVNEIFLRTLLFLREEVIGKTSFELGFFANPAQRQAIKQIVEETGYVKNMEVQMVAKDGHFIDGLFSAEPIVIANENCWLTVMVDMTEQKQAEEALKKSESRLSNIIEFLPDATFVIDQDKKVVAWNRAMEKMSGVSKEDMIGQGDHAYTIPFYGGRRRQLLDLIDGSDKDLESKYQYVQRKGDTLYAEAFTPALYGGKGAYVFATASPLFDNRGNRVGTIESIRDVTDYRRTEEALRDSHSRLDDIIDFLPDATFVIDCKGKVVAWNRAIEQMTGVPKGEMIGKSDYEYAIPFYGQRRPLLIDLTLLQDDDFERNHYEGVYRQGDTLYAEAYVPQTYKGKGASLWGTASRLRDASGNVIGAIESIRDTTERKRAEEALREGEQRLQNIVDGSPIPAFVIGKDHRVLHWNKALEEMSRIKSEEVVGTCAHWRGFYNEERPCLADLLVDEAVELVPQWYSGKYIKSPFIEDAYEATDFFPALGENGKWLSFTAAAIRDSKEMVVAAIETLEDITDRKQAEEALTSERERLASILDGIPVPTFMIDSNHQVVLWNRHNEIYTGIAKEDVLGKPLNLNVLFRKKASPTLAELVLEMEDEELMAKFGRRGLQKSDVYPHTYESTGQILIKEKERTLTIQAARILDSSGEVVGAVQTGQDITDRIQLEIQLRQAQKMEAIGTLAGGIAHDFNNILSAIMGYTDMALADPKLDSRLRRYLEHVFKGGERARDLVKQILAFSRQSDENLLPLRVGPIIKEVLKLLRASLPTTIAIPQDIQSDMDTVLADPTQIHQILMNLCTNAAHAMRETKGELKVSLVPVEVKPPDTLIILHGLTPGMYLKLTVSDTGGGMTPDIIDRIFDPFFTTKKPGEGTGMGLPVVHGIVKSYHGAITVESEAGKGTDFHVYLPLLMEAGEKREVEAGADITGGKERILLVDDEAMLVQLGKDMLTSLGYKVTERTSSLEALELFRSRPDRFDLVITDMTMPNMTGIELAQEIMRIRPGIPVILCTGFSEAITPEKAKSLGLREFIMKPIIRNQIAEAIRRNLDHKD